MTIQRIGKQHRVSRRLWQGRRITLRPGRRRPVPEPGVIQQSEPDKAAPQNYLLRGAIISHSRCRARAGCWAGLYLCPVTPIKGPGVTELTRSVATPKDNH